MENEKTTPVATPAWIWIESFRAARRVGTPLIAVETADPIQAAREIAASTSSDPAIWWDCAAGPRPINEAARGVVSSVYSDPYQALNLVEALKLAERLPEGAILLLSLAHRFIEEPGVVQAISNLREPWKSTGATLVMLVQPGSRLPSELSQDVYMIENPLPTPSDLRPIVDEISRAAVDQLGKPMPSDEVRQRAAEALVGLSSFAAESAVALAVNDGGLEADTLWGRKRAAINSTPGLTLNAPGAETFDKVGGLSTMREFASRLFGDGTGMGAPRLIVWIDEIEKSIAGAGTSGGTGDTSGTSQDQLGVLLRCQEENGWGGFLLVGPPGSGKSMIAKAIGATHKIPTISLDPGAMKGSLVGQSEQRIRAAMRVIQALAGREAFFIATCNRLDSVPPELRRRYKYGIWFADLPTADERTAIWKIHLTSNGFKNSDRPGDPAWTGAEIRNCCELARRLSITPAEAASYIVPVSQSDPEGIERLRRAADGRFLSVSYPGPYRASGPDVAVRPSTSGRKMVRG